MAVASQALHGLEREEERQVVKRHSHGNQELRPHLKEDPQQNRASEAQLAVYSTGEEHAGDQADGTHGVCEKYRLPRDVHDPRQLVGHHAELGDGRREADAHQGQQDDQQPGVTVLLGKAHARTPLSSATAEAMDSKP